MHDSLDQFLSYVGDEQLKQTLRKLGESLALVRQGTSTSKTIHFSYISPILRAARQQYTEGNITAEYIERIAEHISYNNAINNLTELKSVSSFCDFVHCLLGNSESAGISIIQQREVPPADKIKARTPLLIANLDAVVEYILAHYRADSADLSSFHLNEDIFRSTLLKLVWSSTPETIQAIGRNGKMLGRTNAAIAECATILADAAPQVVDRLGDIVKRKVVKLNAAELEEQKPVTTAVVACAAKLSLELDKKFDGLEALTVDQIALVTESMVNFQQARIGYDRDGSPNNNVITSMLNVAIDAALKNETLHAKVTGSNAAATAPAPASAPAIAA